MISSVYANKANISDVQPPSVATPTSQNSPLALLQALMTNPTDLDHVKQYTTDDFIYVSLNYENPELKQIMPWAGTTAGREGLVQTFKDVNT